MANLIHGKQLRPNTLKENLLLITGATATNGQILSYDSSNGGFAWINNSTNINVTGGTASYVDEAGTLTFTSSDASTFQVTGVDNDFVTGMTFNNGTYDLSVTRNDGTTFTQNLGILGTDLNVTGGTYDINTGVVTFTTNSGGTFGVTGFTSGMTDSYTTTANTVGNVIQFDNNIQGSNLFNVDLSSILTWDNVLAAGNTSGGNDALLSDGDVLKAVNGDSSLNLRAYGTDGNILLGNGPGDDNFANTAVYLSPTYGGLYWSDSAQTNSNYVEFTSNYGIFKATNNGVLNEIVLQNGGGTGSSFSENSIQVSSLTGSITLSAGSENIYILNDIPLDNSLTTVLARHLGLGGVLREVSVSALTQDIFVTGGTYDGDGEQIVFTNNSAGTFNVDLSALDLNDTFTTGSTLVGSDLYFDNQDTLSAYTVDLSPLLDDTNFYTTGSTLIGDTVYFDRTDTLSAYTLDLSSLDVNDTFVTGGTVASGALDLGLNDASTVNVTGAIVQTVTGNSPITASTTSGAVTVGLDYSSLQLAVQTTADKDLKTTGTTSGNSGATGVVIAATPVNGAYVKVEINGVGYTVGDGLAAGKDLYFSDDFGVTAKAIADIAAGDEMFWNGTTVGFDLDSQDRVDFFYEILA